MSTNPIKKIVSNEQNKNRSDFGLLIYEKIKSFSKNDTRGIFKLRSDKVLTESIKSQSFQVEKLKKLKLDSDKMILTMNEQLKQLKLNNKSLVESLKVVTK